MNEAWGMMLDARLGIFCSFEGGYGEKRQLRGRESVDSCPLSVCWVFP